VAARTPAILVVIVLVCALAGPAAASVALPRILSVEVTGNKKTRASTVRTIARVETGDVWDPALAERAKIELESCGLFQEVAVTWGPAEGGAHLRLKVRDKHSWIIAPTFYFQPGNIGGGGGFGEANLFGTNKKLLLYGQYASADTLFFGTFLDPRFRGSGIASRWGSAATTVPSRSKFFAMLGCSTP
jgi:outer membrane protein assembly factor BamA